MTGKELQKKDLPSGTNQIEFGYGLPAGIYLAEIILDEQKKVLRLVKQHQ